PISAWMVGPPLFLFALAAGRLLRVRPTAREVYRRGAIVRISRSASHRPRRRGEAAGAAPLSLGGVTIRREDETKHFKLIGTTGTGKTTAIGVLLRDAFARGDRAVITDPDGAYLRRFYDRYRGDVILNPFEPHSVRWDPFAEVRGPYDYEELARGLIPRSDDSSGREWRGYARTYVAAVLRRCDAEGVRDVTELWRLLAVAGNDEVRRVVAGTPAQPFLDPDNARMFGSIRSVAVSAIAALEHVSVQRAAPFSVREWVTEGRGALFIPYRAGEIAALRSIIAIWMRLAIFEVMSRTDGERGRMWFVVDELDALGAIDGLKDALARLRKFGGRCVLGFQSVAQVSSTYGGGEAQTLVENCGNTVILRCSGSEHGGTSQFASRLIGEREVVRRHIARSRDRSGAFSSRGSRRSTQVSEALAKEAAVLPSEVEQLADLAGYLKTASSPHWVRISLAREAHRWRSTTSA
ncbi:MAG: type IV secretion system DNA-binding domain-containing protein, partial [Steroidobacteraceae bacterium]